MDSLPTLPPFPEPIDYELQKFVEWRDFGPRHKKYHLYFMGEPIGEVGKKWTEFYINREVEWAYHRIRQRYQAFADVLAQQPIEVEPLVWRTKELVGAIAHVSECRNYQISESQTHGCLVLTTNGTAKPAILEPPFDTLLEAKDYANEHNGKRLSRELNRPVVVKSTK